MHFACFTCSTKRVSLSGGLGFGSDGPLRSPFWFVGVWSDQKLIPLAPELQKIHMINLALFLLVQLTNLETDRLCLANDLVWLLPVGQQLRLNQREQDEDFIPRLEVLFVYALIVPSCLGLQGSSEVLLHECPHLVTVFLQLEYVLEPPFGVGGD